MISSPDTWLLEPARLVLESDEVHVWHAYLNQAPSTVQAFSELLSVDERERAEKFHFRKDREHFIVAHGVLRYILSRYLNTFPDLISFSYNQYGKPALAGGTDHHRLRFNLSHANGIALYAVTRGREVGLDIEFISEDFARLEIAARFFSPQEVATLQALSAELQTTAFFNCWTRKEAYIKARGEGLSHPLHSFAVSCAPGETAALRSVENDPQETSRWSLMEIATEPGYVAALAIEGTAPILRRWQWKVGARIL